MTLHFVIPALNERENLDRLGRRLQEALAACGRPGRVLLVDDGSSDGTAEAAPAAFAPLQVRVLRHPENRGVAAAFRTGFLAGLEDAATGDLIVTLEADNTSDVSLLSALVSEADAGADLVLGSCYAPGGGVQGTDAWRRLLSGSANLMVKSWFGLWGLHTFSSFYRVYRVSALARVFEASHGEPLRERGFASVVELLVRMHSLGMDVREVPVVLRSDERSGKSKMRVLPTILGYFRVMAALGPLAVRVRRNAGR